MVETYEKNWQLILWTWVFIAHFSKFFENKEKSYCK